MIVPLSFLDPDGRWPLVVISLSFLPLDTHKDFGIIIRQTAEDIGRRVAFIASGDLSHRLTPDAPAGYAPQGKDFDAEVVRLVAAADLDDLRHLDTRLVSEAGECGLRSFVMLGGFLSDDSVTSKILHYEGPWGVGYLSAVVGTSDVLTDDESPHVTLARRAIETFLRSRQIINAPEDPVFRSTAAAFVSLHREHALRGCIGTFEPSCETLGEEIITMAIQAATQDPRFPSLAIEELTDLEISVDVLEPPEAVESIHDLDSTRYGVIVSKDWRRGLLLPDLEGVDTATQQVDIARRKAGIGPDEIVRLERFRVERFR